MFHGSIVTSVVVSSYVGFNRVFSGQKLGSVYPTQRLSITKNFKSLVLFIDLNVRVTVKV